MPFNSPLADAGAPPWASPSRPHRRWESTRRGCAAAQPVAAEPTDSGNGNVLIVEDDPRGARLLEAHLRGAGYRAIVAHSAQDAIAAIEQALPDIVLCDVCLPEMDGIEFTRAMRAQERTANLPIALITSSDDSQILARGLDAGADDFLSKPVNALELRTRVRSLLRSKVLADELRVRGQAGPSPALVRQSVATPAERSSNEQAAGAGDRRQRAGSPAVGSLPVGFRVSHAAGGQRGHGFGPGPRMPPGPDRARSAAARPQWLRFHRITQARFALRSRARAGGQRDGRSARSREGSGSWRTTISSSKASSGSSSRPARGACCG